MTGQHGPVVPQCCIFTRGMCSQLCLFCGARNVSPGFGLITRSGPQKGCEEKVSGDEKSSRPPTQPLNLMHALSGPDSWPVPGVISQKVRCPYGVHRPHLCVADGCNPAVTAGFANKRNKAASSIRFVPAGLQYDAFEMPFYTLPPTTVLVDEAPRGAAPAKASTQAACSCGKQLVIGFGKPFLEPIETPGDHTFEDPRGMQRTEMEVLVGRLGFFRTSSRKLCHWDQS